MKFVIVPLLLLCSGFVCDFTLLPEHVILNPLKLVSKLQIPLHRHISAAESHAIIAEAARKHKVPAAFVKSIVAAESNFDCDAISSKGAIGLMQLMPETAEEYGADPANPEQNIDAGTRYLRVLLNRYHKYRNCLPRAIAAYNAGPGVVDHYRGVPPYPETRGYVKRVLGFLHRFEKEQS